MATNGTTKVETKEVSEKSLNGVEIGNGIDEKAVMDMKAYIAKLEKQLQDADAEILKSKVTLDGCVDAVVTVNAKNIISYWNPAAEKLWGYAPSEVIGQPMYKFAPEGMRDQHIKGMDNYLKTGEKKVLGKGREVKILRKDGIEVAVLLTLSEAKLGSETIFTAFIKDITDMKKQEFLATQQLEEMRAQEEEIRQNMEEMQTTQEELSRKMREGEMMKSELDARVNALNAAAILSEADPAGNIIYTNDKLTEISGFTREEMLGKPHNIFRHPDNPKSLYKEMWDTIKSGKIFQGSYPNKKKDGTDYWVDATIAPVMGEDGKPVKYVGIRFDITKSMEQKVEMEKKEADMQGIMNAINASYASVEFDKFGNVLGANDNFLKAIGYTLGEIKGKHHRIFCDQEYANTADYKSFWENLGKGITQKGDFKRISKSGGEIWLNAAYTPVVDKDGTVVKVLKIATDTTIFTIGFQQATAFINQIKLGNFKAKMDFRGLKMTGEIGKVTEDLADLKDVMEAVMNEVNRVVNLAGNEGQLRERLKISGMEGSWGELVDSLNALLTNISEPVLEINRLVTSMAQGDLTQSFNRTARGDIQDMANALNIAIKNLNKLLKEIEKSSHTVATSSIQMTRKSEGMMKSTTEVSSAIKQMADGAQEQASRTDETSKLVEAILKQANEMGTRSDIINTSAQKGQESCQNGIKIIKDLVNNMSGIASSADSTGNSIEVLTQRSEEISRTLNVITDIASQTNLLALNAAIEAARAGDAGRGFAVVAEEIRKLAEDSRRSAVDIDKVIKDVQKDVSLATKAIEKMKTNVEGGSAASKEAESVFNSIFSSSSETLGLSKDILEASKSQKEGIGNVVKNIEKIVVVSEEVAAGTQEIASSSTELNKGMVEITTTSENLSKVAEELKRGVDQFKLN